MKKLLALVAVALVAAVLPAVAQEAMLADHGVVAPEDIQWGPAPPFFPPGMKTAVLEGNPAEEGVYTLRAWMPAGYRVAPHFHPTFEYLTVLSGEGRLGMGDRFDATQGQVIPPGGFAYLAPGAHHYFWVETDTVLQVHGIGPFFLYYLNPADDPRNQPAP